MTPPAFGDHFADFCRRSGNVLDSAVCRSEALSWRAWLHEGGGAVVNVSRWKSALFSVRPGSPLHPSGDGAIETSSSQFSYTFRLAEHYPKSQNTSLVGPFAVSR